MRVVILNEHSSDILGGSQMQCDLIARGLVERGHRVLYCAVGKKRSPRYEGFPYDITPLAIETPGALEEILRREKPDVLYWRFNRRYLDRAVSEARRVDVPFVFAVSNPRDLKRFGGRVSKDVFAYGFGRTTAHRVLTSVRSIPQELMIYKALKRVDAITVLNADFLDRVPVEKKRHIRNAVAPKKTAFAWPRPFCLWVANIMERKRPELFLDLARRLSPKLRDLDFVMIGPVFDTHYNASIDAAARQANFHHLGFQPPEEVNGALEKAICLVHTCKPEGFGNNFIQAWMQGCPTVSLEFDPEGLIAGKELGYVSGSQEQLERDVERLVNDEGLRNEMGARARKFAREHFLPDRMAAEVESFLQEVIDEHESVTSETGCD